MKRKTLLLAAAAMAIAGILWSYDNTQKNNMSTSTTFAMNTFIEQKWYGKNSDEVIAGVNSLVADIERDTSMHLKTSEIGQINAKAGISPVQVSSRTMELLQKAKMYSQKSDGSFDITIAPVVELWGITGFEPKIPTATELAKALAKLNLAGLVLDKENGTAYLEKAGMAIDLGGVAKGWACDVIREYALSKGVQSGYVSLGGNMMIIGDKPSGEPYKFGLRNPLGTAEEYIGVVTLKGKTMATTGGYERFFEENGEKYHHVLDPKTGYPADSDLLSVSVISASGALADYLSTAFFVLGKEKTLECIGDERYEIIMIDRENRVYVSKSLQKDFTPNADNAFDFTNYN